MRTFATIVIGVVGVLGAGSVTHASAAELVVRPEGAVVLESATAAVRIAGEAALVELSIVVASRLDDQVGRVDLRLPDDSRVVGMSYTQGGEHVLASVVGAGDARRRFEMISGVVDRVFARSSERMLARATERRLRDPALLEADPRARDNRGYRLSVFPMSSFDRTAVSISIAMPRFSELVITDYDRRWVIGAKAFSISKSGADLALIAQTSSVNQIASLYAAPEELPVAYPALRSVIATTRDDMRRCLGHHGRTRALDLIVKFTIGSDGTALAPKVIGGWRELNTCIAAVAQTWQFDAKLADSEPISYPLHLTP